VNPWSNLGSARWTRWIRECAGLTELLRENPGIAEIFGSLFAFVLIHGERHDGLPRNEWPRLKRKNSTSSLKSSNTQNIETVAKLWP
jgi:hypothetical protein